MSIRDHLNGDMRNRQGSQDLSYQENSAVVGDIDLRHYLALVNQFKWQILSISAVVTLLAALFVSTITPTYQTTGRILIESQSANLLTVDEVYGSDWRNAQYYRTQAEILKSRIIVEKVIARLGLLDVVEEQQESAWFDIELRDWLPFLPEKQSLSTEEMAYLRKEGLIANITRTLEVKPVAGTRLVDISYASSSPKFAADLINNLGQVYIDTNLENRIEMTQQATSWLSERLISLRSKLEASELALQNFQEAEGLVDLDDAGVQVLASQELAQLNGQLVDSRKELEEVSSLYRLIQTYNGDVVELETLSAISDHAMIQDVKTSEAEASRKVAELSRRYGPKHPKMIDANNDLVSIRGTLHARIKKLVSGITKQYQTAKANVAALRNALSGTKSQFQTVSRVETRFKELKRNVEIDRQLYDAFLLRYNEATEATGFDQVNARMADLAPVPTYPVKPNKRFIIGLAFLMSFGLSIVLVFFLDFLHDGIRHSDDVENKLGMRMMGLFPLMKTDKKGELKLRSYFDGDLHAFSEAVNTLRTSFVLNHLEKPAKIIAVTSSVPGEGKTTISINMAFSLAGINEKVLLIDADMRRPSMAKNFSMPRYTLGLSNILSGSNSLNECIHRDEASGIDIIPAGLVPPNPQALLSSSNFPKVLQVLRKQYDRIIVDTAPTQAVSDALLIAQEADSVLYVVKSESTRQKIITNALGRLLQVGAPIDGVVLNLVDVQKKTGYGYYHGYYDQYGYGAENAQAAKANDSDRGQVNIA